MIPQTIPTWQTTNWQEQLQSLIRDPRELCQLLNLDPELVFPAQQASQNFALRVPRSFVARMEKGNPSDPLLLQALPLSAELTPTPGYTTDPLEEQKANPVPGLIHKYHGRVLMVLAGSCAINCRYCFRRHFPYESNKPNPQHWAQALDYIRADSTINEVIFSGGDPLTLADKHLRWFGQQMLTIPHLKRLRIHSRLPVVLPARIDQDFTDWLAAFPLQKIMVIHSNHANEINQPVREAIKALREAGTTVLNQTVLLKGVNDCADTLVQLSEALFNMGVLPYYLHLLDKVQGAAHFDVTAERAAQLHGQISARLPGFLVPKLVREDAGALAKTLVYTQVENHHRP